MIFLAHFWEKRGIHVSEHAFAQIRPHSLLIFKHREKIRYFHGANRPLCSMKKINGLLIRN